MRLTAIAVACLLLVSGCITGGSDESAENAQSGDQGQRLNVSANGTGANATGNATYLKDSDYNRTHVHDYWPGISQKKVLMNHGVDVDRFTSVFYTMFSPLFREPKTGVGVTWFTLPNGSFVPLGTGELSVQVDATGALENGKMALAYNPANQDGWTETDPQGAQANWTIPVTPETVDLPHAKSTRWDFRLEAKGHGAVLDGKVNVTVVAHKTRNLDSWPAHPDFWNKGQKTSLHLARMNATYDEQELEFGAGPVEGGEQNITLPEGEIVPPETRLLLLEFWYHEAQDPRNQANADVTLRVKQGSSGDWFSDVGEHVIRERDGFKAYAIPVDGSTVDSPYADRSDWKFRVYTPAGARTETGTVWLGFGELGKGNVTIDATAYREIPDRIAKQVTREEDSRSAQAARVPAPVR